MSEPSNEPREPSALRTIFNGALERSDMVERARFLEQACGKEAALRAQVEELLAAHERLGGFLAEPQTPRKNKPPGAIVLALTEKAGDRIGRYKLLQQIGEGGCGVVYMAEQEEPVRRRVALKVIKLGMDTKQVVGRFEAERQALALMDHSNIAKVLDAGATESGRPYFVMELVRGVKITEFCDQQKLSTHERLELFVQVCSAVQHAHQKGIIHRDLKPSNILVTTVDGVPVAKVIDFGVAKATSNLRLTDKTLFTAFEQFIGTPAYMSPEQAEMSGVDIDTRTDIYSLGVVLYELLTGKIPFDRDELLRSGIDEIRRTIRETEPPKPSTRLSTLAGDEGTTVAAARKTEMPALVKLVRGDLDWIVMKCLEKDRARRYETASELALDTQRHLASEPVVARPPTGVYRFQKFFRRHRLGFAVASVLAAMLVISSTVSTWLAVRATQAERNEHRLRLRAEAVSRLDEAILIQEQGDSGRALASAIGALTNAAQLGEDGAVFLEVRLRALTQYLLAEKKFETAEWVFAQLLTPAFQAKTQSAGIFARRADFFARRARWAEAAADAARALERDPTNHIYYCRLAPLLVLLGDADAYRKSCAQAREHFGATRDPFIAQHLAAAYLLAPVSSADLETVGHWVDFALAEGPDSKWNQTLKGCLEYRAGHQAEAVAQLENVVVRKADHLRRQAAAFLIRAMAQHESGQTAAARASFDRSLEIVKIGQQKIRRGELADDWIDTVFTELLYREARKLIEGDSASPGQGRIKN